VTRIAIAQIETLANVMADADDEYRRSTPPHERRRETFMAALAEAALAHMRDVENHKAA
jgi:hypothetical protein